LPLTRISPLPSYSGRFITTDELHQRIESLNTGGCRSDSGDNVLTLLDLRTENHFSLKTPVPQIKSSCPTLFFLLDDLQKPEVRNQIPMTGDVVIITETGNRDQFAMQYLSQFGYRHLSGLLYGMRGWIKAGYPTVDSSVEQGR